MQLWASTHHSFDYCYNAIMSINLLHLWASLSCNYEHRYIAFISIEKLQLFELIHHNFNYCYIQWKASTPCNYEHWYFTIMSIDTLKFVASMHCSYEYRYIAIKSIATMQLWASIHFKAWTPLYCCGKHLAMVSIDVVKKLIHFTIIFAFCLWFWARSKKLVYNQISKVHHLLLWGSICC